MAIKVGKGRSEVTIDGPITESIEAELRDAMGTLIDEMEREADQILQVEIATKWPIKSGRSLGAWFKSLRIHPDSFEVEVVLDNPFTYTRYIRSTKIHKSEDVVRLRSPLVEHARKPATKARRRLRKTLPILLAQALEEEVLNG